MELENKCVVLTGAAGGIGSAVARQLVLHGAHVVLLGRNGKALDALKAELDDYGGGQAHAMVVDLLDAQARRSAVAEVLSTHGQVDILINAAGLVSYRPFAEEEPAVIERIMQLNTVVPMLLTRQLLPGMIARGQGKVVNLGSIFGSIAFAWFAAYSSSKFGLRGFSEALRRELEDTGVGVCYIAPRAVKTHFNLQAVYEMAAATGMNMDQPEWVAQKIVKSILKDRKDVYLGFPESLFVRINAVLPRLVDLALHKQNQKTMFFAKRGAS